MELDETRTVSSAPEQGEATPFERLCDAHGPVTVGLGTTHLGMSVDGNDGWTQTHSEPMTTDSGDPIDFQTALQLASSHLLAKLEEPK